jgi:DNA-directed RNA polymerase specialized sigma24 family protein
LALVTGYLGWRDAQDAAQHIWLAVWRKLWQLEDPDRFEPWLQKPILHQCLKYPQGQGEAVDTGNPIIR